MKPKDARVAVLESYLKEHAPFLGTLNEARSGSTGFEALDHLLGGGFPKSVITALIGEPGEGCTMLAARSLRKDRPAAWIDGRGTLYPPALMAEGVSLSRLLMVRSTPALALYAAEQVIATGAFDSVVISGVERALTSVNARRLQNATEGARTSTIVLLGRAAERLPGAGLKLRLSRRSGVGAVRVEVEKDRSGRASGRRVVLDLVTLKCVF